MNRKQTPLPAESQPANLCAIVYPKQPQTWQEYEAWFRARPGFIEPTTPEEAKNMGWLFDPELGRYRPKGKLSDDISPPMQPFPTPFMERLAVSIIADPVAFGRLVHHALKAYEEDRRHG